MSPDPSPDSLRLTSPPLRGEIGSMAVFWSLIEPLLASREAKRVCEIGLAAGALTTRLLGWARENGCDYVGIDPVIGPELRAMVRPPEMLHRGHSLELLPQIAPCDAYFIDGDHNYHTVSHELEAIARATAHLAAPLIFVHDVGWPWGRRDMYYDQSVIPKDARHASSDTLGVELGGDELVDGGLRAPGVYRIALRSGGPRNGVLTAVEDFRASDLGRGWESTILPCAYGLAVLHPAEGGGEPLRELRAAAKLFDGFLNDIEANCLILYLYGEHMKRNSLARQNIAAAGSMVDRMDPTPPPSSVAAAGTRVTIITRTRDRPLMLPRCLESVLNQTFADWLHLIINDGGNPRVVELAVAEQSERYQGRARIIHNPTALGMQNASNIGVREADGDYLVIHDDDDTWQPDFLRQCVEFLDVQGPGSATQGVITQTARVLEKINVEGDIDELAREDFQPLKTIDLFAAGAGNLFAPIAFVYRRAVHERIGYFEERFSVLGDWDFNLRFLLHYEIGVIEQRLANYHWRHCSGGSAYANTVIDGLELHLQKAAELRNHYLRLDLQEGKLGLGYLLNAAKLQSDARGQGSELIHESIHESRKIHNRLRHWEWLITRNPRLKPVVAPPKPVPARAKPDGHQVGSAQQDLEAAIAGGMEGCRVLSVDVFDTALLRRVRQPVDVFLLLEAPMRSLLGEPNLPVAELRSHAEKRARDQRRAASGHEEVTLVEIYEAFCDLSGAKPERAPQLVQCELDAEARMLYGNPPILAACKAAAAAGLRVVFASDMYLPRDFILGELWRAGFDAGNDSVFVSSERAASKHAGTLYDQMTQALGCQPEEILHVGDNLHSDCEQARARGLRAIHWHPAINPAMVPLVDQAPGSREHGAAAHHDLLSSLCVGAVRRQCLMARPKTPRPGANGNGAQPSAGEDLWDRLGYEVGGPLYFLFLRWILQQARDEGIDRLYFLARDGYHLREACDLMIEQAGLKMQTVYLAASRRLLNLPQFIALDYDALQFLLTPNPDLSVRHLLERVGLDADLLGDKIRRAGFSSAEEMATSHTGAYRSDEVCRMMRTLFVSLEGEILEQAAGERSRLLAYFRQVGFTADAPGKFAAVDLGWQASSAKALQALLNLPGGTERQRLRAFYFGTWRQAGLAMEAGCQLSSFFFHLDQPVTRSGLVAESVELIELFFGAPHPTIVGLREGAGGRLEPVHGGSEGSQEKLTRMRERAVDFVREVAAEGVLDWPGQGFSFLEDTLARILRRPTAMEAQQLGALMARDSFGGSSPTRPLAQPPGRWEQMLHPGRLRQSYQRAFWKAGFLAQLPSQAASRLQR